LHGGVSAETWAAAEDRSCETPLGEVATDNGNYRATFTTCSGTAG